MSGPVLTSEIVLERLSHADLGPIAGQDTVRQPFMQVRGTAFHLRGGDVQVFLYPSEAARRADTDRLDSVRVAPPTMSITWIARPTLVTVGNVAMIVISNDDSLAQRIREALRGA